MSDSPYEVTNEERAAMEEALKSPEEVTSVLITDTEDTEDKPKEVKPKKGPRHWSKEEWVEAGKDEKDWKDNTQFQNETKFYDRISKLNKTIKSLERKIYLQEQQEYQKKREYLEAKRFQAYASADPAEGYKVEEEIRQLEAPSEPEDEPDHKEYQSKIEDSDNKFFENNKFWINENSKESHEMREFAQKIAEKYQYHLQNKAVDPEEVRETIEKALHSKYPHRFRSSNEDDDDYENDKEDNLNELEVLKKEIEELKESSTAKRHPTVETNSYSNKGRVTAKDIPKGYREVYLSMPEEDRKAMPPSAYIEQLKSLGAI